MIILYEPQNVFILNILKFNYIYKILSRIFQ